MQINKLNRLEKKYVACRQKRINMIEKMRQSENEAKKQLEAERYNTVIRTIKKSGFPIEQLGIIVGAVLKAKQKLDEKDTAAINGYIELYNEFLEDEKHDEEAVSGEDVIENAAAVS